MLSGAGQINKTDRPPGRMYERELDSVGADYEQDEIVYQPGFLRQYGWRVLLSWAGFAACLFLILFAFSSHARVGDVWALEPTMIFLVFITPCAFFLPFHWLRVYLRQQAILSDVDDEASCEEVAHKRS